MTARRGTVIHAVAGGEEHPLAVVVRTLKLTLGVVLRLGRILSGRGRRLQAQPQAERPKQYSGKNSFHRCLLGDLVIRSSSCYPESIGQAAWEGQIARCKAVGIRCIFYFGRAPWTTILPMDAPRLR